MSNWIRAIAIVLTMAAALGLLVGVVLLVGYLVGPAGMAALCFLSLFVAMVILIKASLDEGDFR